ncbi:hypothetical protein [Paenibacillus sp. GCM10012306]|uniref:hypothetical protein n=1 Tax=Paenibacillus sp. GCM10012306 TaxID=3317342 RepID=UPI0036D29BEF
MGRCTDAAGKALRPRLAQAVDAHAPRCGSYRQNSACMTWTTGQRVASPALAVSKNPSEWTGSFSGVLSIVHPSLHLDFVLSGGVLFLCATNLWVV